MSDQLHTLERRAELLAGRIKSREEMLTVALTPPGSRPPFTQQMSKPEAVRWWQKHRFDEMGQRVLANMDQQSLLELDAALAGANESEMYGGTDEQY